MKPYLAGLALLGIVAPLGSAARADKAPLFEGAVLFAHGRTRLDLTDHLERVSVPEVFAGWTCYIDATQRNGAAYVKQITCGGKWGFVDTFVSCDPKHRRGDATLRLRQPINGTLEQMNAAEKLSISVMCSYL